MNTIEKIQAKLLSFEVWCIVTGIGEILTLAKKVFVFFLCYISSGVLVFGGYLHLEEVRGIDSISYLFFIISLFVILRGAADIAREGFT